MKVVGNALIMAFFMWEARGGFVLFKIGKLFFSPLPLYSKANCYLTSLPPHGTRKKKIESTLFERKAYMPMGEPYPPLRAKYLPHPAKNLCSLPPPIFFFCFFQALSPPSPPHAQVVRTHPPPGIGKAESPPHRKFLEPLFPPDLRTLGHVWRKGFLFSGF